MSVANTLKLKEEEENEKYPAIQKSKLQELLQMCALLPREVH